MRVVDGRHRFQLLQELLEQSSYAKVNAKLKWISKPLRVSAVRRKDGGQFYPFEMSKISCQSNLTTGIARHDTKCVEVVHTVLYYDETFQDEYFSPVNDAGTSDIATAIHSSNVLSKDIRAKYLRYARVGKLMMKQKELPAFMETMTAENDSRVSLGVTNLQDFRLATWASEVALILVHEVHHYINKPNKMPAIIFVLL